MILNALILTLYFLLYGFLHSWLASLTVKERVQAIVGQQVMRGYRLAYNCFALLSILPFFALQSTLPNPKLYDIPTPWRWFMVTGQMLALAGATITILQTGLPHFLGLSQLVTSQATEHTPLNISGFYKWVRHPIYFFSLIFIWLSPVMYLNQLIGYVLFSFYFYFGSKYEEDKSVTEFGDTYRDYQRHVPRLFPIPYQNRSKLS